MQERLFTINQVADLLATTHREVLHWIAKGWLASKPGPDGADRVSEKALIHFLKGRGVDIMQLLASTAVHHAGRGEGAASGPQPSTAAAAANDRPAAGKAGPSTPQAPKGSPQPAPADDVKLSGPDEQATHPPRPRVLSARNGPAGPSLDEDVASALATREMLTGRPGQLLNDDEVAALLGAPLGQLVRSLERQAPAPAGMGPHGEAPPEASPAAATASPPAKAQPDRAEEPPAMTSNGVPAPAAAHACASGAPDAAKDDGPFVGEVNEIEPDDDAGLEDRRDAKPLSHGQAVVPPLGGPRPEGDSRAALPSPAEQASARAAQVLSTVLDDAVRRGATHVHLHSRRAGLALLVRQAGRLIDKPNFRRMEASQAKAMVGRLLDLAGLAGPWSPQAGADLSRPRSGGFTHTVDGRAVRMTLSSFPTVDGPRLVISLPARLQERLDLAELGARTAEAERIHRLLAARRGGLLLVCGPTRHDRDDVLSALAGQLAGTGRDVLAIGAGNSPVDPVGGYSFRDAALHLAGQDADAVVLAELRDPTTAAAAIEAALAGAMVVAGAAAETAAEALGMLAEMGVESWPLAAMLRGAIVCRKLPRQGPTRGTNTRDGNVRLISLLEPSRELVRLVRAAASAEAIAAAVPGAGPAALRDLAAGAIHDGYLSAEDAARLP